MTAFTILSCDGDGIKGYAQAVWLAQLERETGISIAGFASLFAGTSIGGIHALWFATGGRAAELCQIYPDLARRIFRRRLGKRLLSLGGLVDELYDDRDKRAALEQAFGSRLSWQVERPFLVPAWRPATGRHEMLDERTALSLVDVALATSAAPTYWRRHLVAGMGLVDGGFGANSPAFCAVTEARKRFRAEDIALLSIGTRTLRQIDDEDGEHVGAINGARDIVHAALAAPVGMTDTFCRAHLTPGRYLRVEIELPEELDALDAVGNLARLKDRALAAWSERRADALAWVDQVAETHLERRLRSA